MTERLYRIFWSHRQEWYAVGRTYADGGGCDAFFYMNGNRDEAKREARAFAKKMNDQVVKAKKGPK
jgi:hypothetical protein